MPSLAYRYSFAPNSEWTHVCARGPEILDYLKGIAEQYDLERDIRYGHEVLTADYADGQWCIVTSKGDEEKFDAVLAVACTNLTCWCWRRALTRTSSCRR